MNITVSNFQSIASAALTLEGLTVLVGPSDRGKSALVRAIEAACFNMAGEFFVRTGAPHAEVTLDWPGHTVQWQKGGGKNLFEVDQTTYMKVGQKAPPVLQALGFRDELIGARFKDDGTADGGKWVRPQFARQFDGIYLLDEQGPFINEVIVKLSRLGVLQRAERACALDLRAARGLLKTRQGDLDAATVAAEQLAGAPLLRARLDALIEQDTAREEARASAGRLRLLLADRAAAQAKLAQTLPVLDPLRDSAKVREVAESYAQLRTARQQLERRALLAALPKKLVKSKTGEETPEYRALGAMVARYQRLSGLVGARQMRMTVLATAVTAQEQADRAVHAAQAALNAFRDTLALCPVCERPFSTPLEATA